MAQSSTVSDSTVTLGSLLSAIQVPSEYRNYSDLDDAVIIRYLSEWRSNAEEKLHELGTLIKQSKDLPLSVQADVVAHVAAFDGGGPWVSPTLLSLAQDILQHFDEPEATLLKHILETNVKCIFASNPHPSLNLSTGRKLARPAGGPMATHDYYDEQLWKRHPGVSDMLSWCVRHMTESMYEDLWHLVIPPIMTLLDDFEAQYKIRGAEIVSEMLRAVPRSLLKRTGVDGLLLSSLNNSLAHLQRPETPALLRAAIRASLSLTLHTTDPGSNQRFDQLCNLLGERIIGGVWLYGSLDLPAVQASIDILPPVVSALGIGCTRYLKALIPQLVHPLSLDSLAAPSLDLQIGSLRAVMYVIEHCAPRIHRWKGLILEGVSKCWVIAVDCGATDAATKQLKLELVNVCKKLAEACPSVVQNEYKMLLAADPKIFDDLVGRIESCKPDLSATMHQSF